MRPSFLLMGLASTLTRAALQPYKVSDYISDCIGSFCYYTFSISYMPSSPHIYSLPLSEPAFDTRCSYSTDDGDTYVSCDDKSLTTIGDFSSGQDLKLTILHSWKVTATAAKPAGTYLRKVKKAVQLYLGSAGVPASFQIVGGSEMFLPANKTVPSKKKTGMKDRRDGLLME